MFNITLRTLYTVILIFSFGFGADMSSAAKAVLLPGWGQMEYNRSHGNILMTTDLTLIAAYLGYSAYESMQQRDLESYAARYANASMLYDNEQYWTDLGNYMSYEAFRTAMLESRQPERIYDEKYAWDWIDVDRANSYLDQRRGRDISRNRQVMIGGAMVLNRLISLVDMIYLQNRAGKMRVSYDETAMYRGLSLEIQLP